MAQSQQWIITTSQDRPVAEIAKELSSAGFAVEQVLDEIGSITGRASKAVAAKLRAIKGVVDVSPSTGIDIGPPGSGDTW